MKAQRLRVTFTRGEDMKYITHLDMMRFWERALRRAGLPLAYSEGFTPHAQLSLAAPLPVGTTSDAELMDVFLEQPVRPSDFRRRADEQLPPGVSIVSVREVGLALPALQADTRWAEYEVDVDAREAAGADQLVERFLTAESVPWEHKREDEVRSYDIRTLVQDIRLARPAEGRLRVKMRLRSDNTGSGRPEQVAAAIGLPPPLRIHRTRIILANRSPSIEAWRKRGRFAS
jgi:radical SAM-linked protein